jgi:colanic acid/amylovoran biosynthesis protein
LTRVLIVNGYSARNRGDGMIINQMIRLFQERGCSVRLMSDDPADAREGIPWTAPLVHIWPTDPDRPSRPRMLAQTFRHWLRPPAVHPAFAWAELCVAAGGGYLYDDGSLASRLNIVLRLLPLRAARRADVPVVLFSQSVGPFASPRWAGLAARELRQAELVIVREELSLGVCRALGIERLELCDDVAFALRPSDAAVDERPKGAAGELGVTVMNALPGVDENGYRAYRDALRDGLVAGLRGRPERVVVVSQVAAHEGDSDIPAARALAADLAAAGVPARFVDLGDRADAELSAFYGRLDLVLASRLHSGILALCAATPIIALSYLPKTDGVLARVGMPEMVQPAHGLQAGTLATALREALDGRASLQERLRERLPALRHSAERAADLALAAERYRG